MKSFGIDFAFRFGFAENNSKKIAGCDTRTSNPAIAELRKVQHDNFAPCDSLMLHLATSRYRTLPLSPVAPCDAKMPFFTTKTALRVTAPPLRSCLEPPLPTPSGLPSRSFSVGWHHGRYRAGCVPKLQPHRKRAPCRACPRSFMPLPFLTPQTPPPHGSIIIPSNQADS